MRIAPTLALALAALPALAGPAEVVDVRAERQGEAWTFHVTVRHADEGWDHYADGWTVLAPDGTELGHRTLHHPHVEEQPFTRSLSGVTVPEGVTEVLVRPHDSVHGPGPDFTLPLPRNP
jgi:hypothetical protein